MTQPLRLACLISGGGRTMLNLADHIERGDLPARIEVVISSRSDVMGVERAWQRGLEVKMARSIDYQQEEDLFDAIYKWLDEYAIDLVCFCGYLRWLRIDPAWRTRMINIHPSILPAFGGRGMFGKRVHQAALDAGHTYTGCTVHFVDEQYDHGPVILQRACPVLPDDDADSLAARVFREECLAYPQAVRLIAEGRVELRDGRAVRYAGRARSEADHGNSGSSSLRSSDRACKRCQGTIGDH